MDVQQVVLDSIVGAGVAPLLVAPGVVRLRPDKLVEKFHVARIVGLPQPDNLVEDAAVLGQIPLLGKKGKFSLGRWAGD